MERISAEDCLKNKVFDKIRHPKLESASPHQIKIFENSQAPMKLYRHLIHELSEKYKN
jgi:hypothetical protein